MTTIKDILEQEIKKAEAEINLAEVTRDKDIAEVWKKHTLRVQNAKVAIKAMKKMIALFDKHNKVFTDITASVPKETA